MLITQQIIEKSFSWRNGLLGMGFILYWSNWCMALFCFFLVLFSHPCALVLTSTIWLICTFLFMFFSLLFSSLLPLHVWYVPFCWFWSGFMCNKLFSLVDLDRVIWKLKLIIHHISFNAGFCTINVLAPSIIQ